MSGGPEGESGRSRGRDRRRAIAFGCVVGVDFMVAVFDRSGLYRLGPELSFDHIGRKAPSKRRADATRLRNLLIYGIIGRHLPKSANIRNKTTY